MNNNPLKYGKPHGMTDAEALEPMGNRKSRRVVGKKIQSKKPDLITLRCPQCKREKKAVRDKSDLAGTSVVVAHCEKCDGEDNGVYPEYYRKDGTQILEG